MHTRWLIVIVQTCWILAGYFIYHKHFYVLKEFLHRKSPLGKPKALVLYRLSRRLHYPGLLPYVRDSVTCKYTPADVEPNRPALFLLTRYTFGNWGRGNARDGSVNGPIMFTTESSQITLTVDVRCDWFHLVF